MSGNKRDLSYIRNIFGTITYPKTSDDDIWKDKEKWIEIFRKTSTSYTRSILAREKHKDKRWHYHFLICYDPRVRQRTLDDLRVTFETLTGSKTNNITSVVKKYGLSNVLAYVIKDDSHIKDGIWDEDFMLIKLLKKEKQKCDMARKCGGVTDSKAPYKEIEMEQTLLLFFQQNKLMVNTVYREVCQYAEDGTLELLGNEFWQMLCKSSYYDKFKIKGKEYAEKHVSDPHLYIMPMWYPNYKIVEFNDCYWHLDEGKGYCKNARKFINNPVRKYNFDLPRDKPTLWLNMLKRAVPLKKDRLVLLETFASQFKTKIRYTKVLHLFGPTRTGKSMLIYPFLDVFKNVVIKWCDDNCFAYSALQHAQKVHAEELNPFDKKHNYNSMKQLTEGTLSTAQNKHSVPVKLDAVTMVITSNTDYSQLQENKDIDALKERIESVACDIKVATKNVELEKDLTGLESARVMTYLTSGDYMNLFKK